MKNFDVYDPKLYATSGDGRCTFIQKLFTKNVDRVKWHGGESVLDIGCGIGDVTRRVILPLLPPDYRRLVCADPSKVMLKDAEKELQGVKNVEFLEMDAEADLDSSLHGKFNKIFSTHCFMYLKDQRKSFENVFKLLAPGGECFITLLVNGVTFETSFRLSETPKWKEHLKHHRDVFIFPYREDPDPEKTARNLLQSIGFSDVYAEKENFFGFYPTKESFRENLIVMPEYPNNMTEKEKEELLEDQIKLGIEWNFIEECHDKNKTTDQPRHTTLTIYAKKP